MRGARALRGALVALGTYALARRLAGSSHAAPGDSFTISGALDRTLYPGGSGSLNLLLTNPGGTDLTVGEITVRVAGVSSPPQRQCLVADFVVTQLDFTLQFILPANATRTLTQLGVAAADLPQVAMTNTPVNQDGCKNSTVNLAFDGRAAEIGGVTVPPAPTPTPTPADDDEPDDVGGVDLPGTGGDSSTFWMALTGLALITAGGSSVVVGRRSKGAQK